MLKTFKKGFLFKAFFFYFGSNFGQNFGNMSNTLSDISEFLRFSVISRPLGRNPGRSEGSWVAQRIDFPNIDFSFSIFSDMMSEMRSEIKKKSKRFEH